MDTNEIMVTEAVEIVKNPATLVKVAKNCGKGVVVMAAAYGLFCGAKKLVSLVKGKKTIKKTAEDVDLMDMDLGDDYSINE